jgi:hypothetical protein
MPQLVSASGQVADTENQKAELLTSISFPEDRAREDCPIIPGAEGEKLVLWTKEDTSRFLGTRSIRSAPGADGLTYRELRLWFKLDPEGLTLIVNRLVQEGCHGVGRDINVQCVLIKEMIIIVDHYTLAVRNRR